MLKKTYWKKIELHFIHTNFGLFSFVLRVLSLITGALRAGVDMELSSSYA
jgi:hypothetical protein